MEKMVLSVKKEVFKAKKPGEKDATFWRVYLAADDGSVGYLYSNKEVAAGDVVQLALRERDGRLKLAIIHGGARG